MNFDPHPENLLGKGILEPTLEDRLIAEGCRFAKYFYYDAQAVPILITSLRPYRQSITELFTSSNQSVLA